MSLDDKLQEILNYFTDRPMPDNKQYRQGQDNIIAQIKQAFADEGYVQTLKLNGRTIVLNGKDPLGYVVYSPEEELIKATPENVSAPFSVMLTGQEWYARFDKEYMTLVKTLKDKDLAAFLGAKRAAGISEPKSANGQGAGF